MGRTEPTGLTSALLGFATAHFSAAGWVPLCRLRDATNPKKARGGGGFDDSAESSLADGPPAGAHRMSSEEVALVQQTESLVRSLAAARSARAMSELVAAGAAEYLSRRVAALLSPEGRLLPMGGGRAPVGLEGPEGDWGGWGAKSVAAIERGLADAREKATRAVTSAAAAAAAVGPHCGVPADLGSRGLSATDQAARSDPEVAAEARSLAQALASICSHNGAALLPEAVRRCGAQDALLRSFLGGWRGALGEGAAPLSDVEACVEELANADLTLPSPSRSARR